MRLASLKYAERRRELKKQGDYAALQRLPRNSSATRLRNLCAITGRSRSVYRKFKISRIKLRELALDGNVRAYSRELLESLVPRERGT